MLFFFKVSHSMSIVEFYDCKFSGLFASSNKVDILFKNADLYRCSCNIRSINNNGFILNEVNTSRIGYKILNCNFRFNIRNGKKLISTDMYNSYFKYCKFSGIIHNERFFPIKYDYSSSDSWNVPFVNCVWQIKFKNFNYFSGEVHLKTETDAIGFINDDYSSSNFKGDDPDDINAKILRLPGKKPEGVSTNEYLLNTEYLLSKNFPVFSEDEEDPDLI